MYMILIIRFVLIETLWNVKKFNAKAMHGCEMGFNRNIVECKDDRESDRFAGKCVLIETLWNVK